MRIAHHDVLGMVTNGCAQHKWILQAHAQAFCHKARKACQSQVYLLPAIRASDGETLKYIMKSSGATAR